VGIKEDLAWYDDREGGVAVMPKDLYTRFLFYTKKRQPLLQLIVENKAGECAPSREKIDVVCE
jgi:hypothetical protein